MEIVVAATAELNPVASLLSFERSQIKSQPKSKARSRTSQKQTHHVEFSADDMEKIHMDLERLQIVFEFISIVLTLYSLPCSDPSQAGSATAVNSTIDYLILHAKKTIPSLCLRTSDSKTGLNSIPSLIQTVDSEAAEGLVLAFSSVLMQIQSSISSFQGAALLDEAHAYLLVSICMDLLSENNEQMGSAFIAALNLLVTLLNRIGIDNSNFRSFVFSELGKLLPRVDAKLCSGRSSRGKGRQWRVLASNVVPINLHQTVVIVLRCMQALAVDFSVSPHAEFSLDVVTKSLSSSADIIESAAKAFVISFIEFATKYSPGCGDSQHLRSSVESSDVRTFLCTWMEDLQLASTTPEFSAAPTLITMLSARLINQLQRGDATAGVLELCINLLSKLLAGSFQDEYFKNTNPMFTQSPSTTQSKDEDHLQEDDDDPLEVDHSPSRPLAICCVCHYAVNSTPPATPLETGAFIRETSTVDAIELITCASPSMVRTPVVIAQSEARNFLSCSGCRRGFHKGCIPVDICEGANLSQWKCAECELRDATISCLNSIPRSSIISTAGFQRLKEIISHSQINKHKIKNISSSSLTDSLLFANEAEVESLALSRLFHLLPNISASTLLIAASSHLDVASRSGNSLISLDMSLPIEADLTVLARCCSAVSVFAFEFKKNPDALSANKTAVKNTAIERHLASLAVYELVQRAPVGSFSIGDGGRLLTSRAVSYLWRNQISDILSILRERSIDVAVSCIANSSGAGVRRACVNLLADSTYHNPMLLETHEQNILAAIQMGLQDNAPKVRSTALVFLDRIVSGIDPMTFVEIANQKGGQKDEDEGNAESPSTSASPPKNSRKGVRVLPPSLVHAAQSVLVTCLEDKSAAVRSSAIRVLRTLLVHPSSSRSSNLASTLSTLSLRLLDTDETASNKQMVIAIFNHLWIDSPVTLPQSTRPSGAANSHALSSKRTPVRTLDANSISAFIITINSFSTFAAAESFPLNQQSIFFHITPASSPAVSRFPASFAIWIRALLSAAVTALSASPPQPSEAIPALRALKILSLRCPQAALASLSSLQTLLFRPTPADAPVFAMVSDLIATLVPHTPPPYFAAANQWAPTRDLLASCMTSMPSPIVQFAVKALVPVCQYMTGDLGPQLENFMSNSVALLLKNIRTAAQANALLKGHRFASDIDKSPTVLRYNTNRNSDADGGDSVVSSMFERIPKSVKEGSTISSIRSSVMLRTLEAEEVSKYENILARSSTEVGELAWTMGALFSVLPPAHEVFKGSSRGASVRAAANLRTVTVGKPFLKIERRLLLENALKAGMTSEEATEFAGNPDEFVCILFGDAGCELPLTLMNSRRQPLSGLVQGLSCFLQGRRQFCSRSNILNVFRRCLSAAYLPDVQRKTVVALAGLLLKFEHDALELASPAAPADQAAVNRTQSLSNCAPHSKRSRTHRQTVDKYESEENSEDDSEEDDDNDNEEDFCSILELEGRALKRPPLALPRRITAVEGRTKRSRSTSKIADEESELVADDSDLDPAVAFKMKSRIGMSLRTANHHQLSSTSKRSLVSEDKKSDLRTTNMRRFNSISHSKDDLHGVGYDALDSAQPLSRLIPEFIQLLSEGTSNSTAVPCLLVVDLFMRQGLVNPREMISILVPCLISGSSTLEKLATGLLKRITNSNQADIFAKHDESIRASFAYICSQDPQSIKVLGAALKPQWSNPIANVYYDIAKNKKTDKENLFRCILSPLKKIITDIDSANDIIKRFAAFSALPSVSSTQIADGITSSIISHLNPSTSSEFLNLSKKFVPLAENLCLLPHPINLVLQFITLVASQLVAIPFTLESEILHCIYEINSLISESNYELGCLLSSPPPCIISQDQIEGTTAKYMKEENLNVFSNKTPNTVVASPVMIKDEKQSILKDNTNSLNNNKNAYRMSGRSSLNNSCESSNLHNENHLNNSAFTNTYNEENNINTKNNHNQIKRGDSIGSLPPWPSRNASLVRRNSFSSTANHADPFTCRRDNNEWIETAEEVAIVERIIEEQEAANKTEKVFSCLTPSNIALTVSLSTIMLIACKHTLISLYNICPDRVKEYEPKMSGSRERSLNELNNSNIIDNDGPLNDSCNLRVLRTDLVVALLQPVMQQFAVPSEIPLCTDLIVSPLLDKATSRCLEASRDLSVREASDLNVGLILGFLEKTANKSAAAQQKNATRARGKAKPGVMRQRGKAKQRGCRKRVEASMSCSDSSEDEAVYDNDTSSSEN